MAKSYLFDVPPGVLNDVNSELITRRIDDSTIFNDDYGSQTRSFIEDAYSENVLEGMGPWKGVVMRIDIKPVPRAMAEGYQHHLSPEAKSRHKKTLPQGKSPMLVHLKCRIPILHAHLPIPRTGNTADPNYPDHYIIDQYPTYTAMSDGSMMAKVKVGDVVILDYADRKTLLVQYTFHQSHHRKTQWLSMYQSEGLVIFHAHQQDWEIKVAPSLEEVH